MTLQHKVHHIRGRNEVRVEHPPKRSIGFLPATTRTGDSKQADCPECRFIVGYYYPPSQAMSLFYPNPSPFSSRGILETARMHERAMEVSRQGFCHWRRERRLLYAYW